MAAIYDDATHERMKTLVLDINAYLAEPSSETAANLTLDVGDLHYSMEQQDRERRAISFSQRYRPV